MKPQLYSGMWIPLSWEVKGRIAELFNIPRNGPTHVVNNQIKSDGYLDIDLARVNVESLQKELDSSETDFFKLWNQLVEYVQAELKPAVSQPKEEKKDIQVNITIEGDKVKVSQETVVPTEVKVEDKPKRTYVKKIKQDSTPAA